MNNMILMKKYGIEIWYLGIILCYEGKKMEKDELECNVDLWVYCY